MNGPHPDSDMNHDEGPASLEREGVAPESIDESWVAALLPAVDRDLPQPDEEFLARLRALSLAEFTDTGRQVLPDPSPAATPPLAAESKSSRSPQPPFSPVFREQPMISLPLKALSACVAGIALTIAALFSPLSPPLAQASFGQVLDRLASAPGVEVRIDRPEGVYDVLVDSRGRARVDEPGGSFSVIRDQKVFTVSNRNSPAVSRPAPFATDRHSSDQTLLGLLGIDLGRHLDIRRQRPIESVQRDGKNWHRYRFTIVGDTRTLTVDAEADAATHALRQLAVTPVPAAGGAQQDVTLTADARGGAFLGRGLERIELDVVLANVDLNAQKFEVHDRLADDGRLGQIVDAQGLVSLKPAGQTRWTPVAGKLQVRPGDQLRSSVRGANAALVRLESGAEVTIGPGGLVEFIDASNVRLLTGELATHVGEGQTLSLAGPVGGAQQLQGEQFCRGEDRSLTFLENAPRWLDGFRGAVVRESLGMLEAKVDSRNVPLTVGYHRVRVDIRDQIARTEIEESFVNHTDQRLEGVFTFPLPADASISGFGMWIGNELVEADVVEKQRAREIYETILAEKRDPGLLEWTAGNLFKARVFPIEPHSEKRIRISYTQVLPWRNGSYRYSYALQSDLLREHPVRELSLAVTVASVLSIRNVVSPSHAVDIEQTEHAARVEFLAQQYTPNRDFEVVVEADNRNSELVVIPHRRGDDGYFLTQFTPPASGEWKREVLPDGKPLDLVILADTSASIDAGQRRQQEEFVEALLASLTPRDRFNLAVCDVECTWAFPQKQMADSASIDQARKILETRSSLGWSDLATGFEAAFAQCGPETQVVYLGDGVVTADSSDPHDFAQRLARLHAGVPGTVHAVALGSTYELPVLQGMAALGGGTLRYVTQERPGRLIAVELLADLVRPGLRNLQVDFRGIQVAAVYPNRLSNLPEGSQQVLLGRFLPTAGAQAGEVVVRGELEGRPVAFSAPIVLEQGEEGNSFIPRLWARMRLDELLAQGQSESVRDDVIALSEEFQIMTPYTSFLVLETDADRERFKVKRRFRIRDGERFFQEGRDDARFELVQQQMRRAGNWRFNLRAQVLQQFGTLGRDLSALQTARANDFDLSGQVIDRTWQFDSFRRGAAPWGGPMGGGGAGLGRGEFMNELFLGDSFDSRQRWLLPDGAVQTGVDLGFERLSDSLARVSAVTGTRDKLFISESAGFESDFVWDLGGIREVAGRIESPFEAVNGPMGGSLPGGFSFKPVGGSLPFEPAFDLPALRTAVYSEVSGGDWFGTIDNGRALAKRSFGGGGFGRGYGYPVDRPEPHPWVRQLFPVVPPVPAATPAATHVRPATWTPEAETLARSLLRTDRLAGIPGGLEIVRTSEGYDVQKNRLQSRSIRRELYSPRAWAVSTERVGSQTLIAWCDGKQRGVVGAGFELGTVRQAVAADLLPDQSLELSDASLHSLIKSYGGYQATVEPAGDRRARLKLFSQIHQAEIVFEIDTVRNVVVSQATSQSGQLQSRIVFSEFVETKAGSIARRIESFDDQGRRTSLTTQEVVEHDAGAFTQKFTHELAVRDSSQVLELPLPEVAAAKKALGNPAGLRFEDPFTLVLYYSRSQRWEQVDLALEQCARLATNPRGMAWIREAVWQESRRHEQWRQALPELTSRVLGRPATEHLFLIQYLVGQAGSILEANETLELLATLQRVYDSQPEYAGAKLMLRQQRIGLLNQVGRKVESLALSREVALENPRDAAQQRSYSQALFQAGDYDAAYSWIDRTLADPTAAWTKAERQSLLETQCDYLYQQGRFVDLCTLLQKRIDEVPESMTPWLQYLGALVQADREEEAETLVQQWISAASAPAPLKPEVSHRAQAAINFCFGQKHYLSLDLFDEKWHEPLADFVLTAVAQKGDTGLINQVIGNYRFDQSAPARRVRLALFEKLAKNIETLEIGWISLFLDWTLRGDLTLPREQLLNIRDVLQVRWKEEAESAVRANRNDSQVLSLAGYLLRVLNFVEPEGVLPFLRRQLAEGPPWFRLSYAQSLYDTLLSQSWSAEVEHELFDLFDEIVVAGPPAERLRQQVERLHALSDSMVARREARAVAAVDRLDQLPRKEQAEQRTRIRREAQSGFSDRLSSEIPKRPAELQIWIRLEQLDLDVRAERDLAGCADRALALLDAQPVPKLEPAKVDGQPELPKTAAEEAVERATAQEQLQRRQIERAARLRTVMLLAHLATRPQAEPRLEVELLKFLTNAQSAEPANPLWKGLQYRVLVALDRPQELKTRMTAWLKEADGGRWRLALGYLLAELGDVPGAIALFEATEIEDELNPQAWQALAGWYQAAGRRADYETARIRIFQTIEEWQMSQVLAQRLHPWQYPQGPLPSQLDDSVLLLFRAVFEKSGSPANYLGYLQQFYAATHDFRLLAVLADSVIGHTAGKVYPFVQGMQTVLREIRDEATADELCRKIGEVRERVKTPVDQRALDLLELQVERRAAEVQNQPGPHIDRAVSALNRALSREGWSAGEPRLMADVLAGLGNITADKLAQVRLRGLVDLHAAERVGSFDRLHIAQRQSEVLWGRGDRALQEQAVVLLEAALREYEQAEGGMLPTPANNALATQIEYLKQLDRFVGAEQLIERQLQHPVHGQQKLWLTDRLYEVWQAAFNSRAQVSLGRGDRLYQAMLTRWIADLEATGDQAHRYNLNSMICSLFRIAQQQQIRTVVDDLQKFAATSVPELLQKQTTNYSAVVSTVALTLHDVAGPRDGLKFLIERVEQSPAWFRHSYNTDPWQSHCWYLAEWRRELGDIGDLTPRLLAIAVAELKHDLTSRQARNRILYGRDYDSLRFWVDQTPAFVAAADEVSAARGNQAEAVEYIAQFLWNSLGQEDRAIALLFDAHRRRILRDQGRNQLAQYLLTKQRFGESVALLEQQVEESPDNVEYVVMLAFAYYQTQRPEDVARVQHAAENRYRARKSWGEGPALRLGQSALQTARYADSVKWLSEAIALRQESRVDRGASDGTLGGYFSDRARAYAGLGQTAQAVEDATSALVVWGPDARQHAEALNALRFVLQSAPDVVKFTAELDRETADAQTDRPAVRRVLGEVLLEKKLPQLARGQLLKAQELRPADPEIQRLLVTCHDQLEDPRGAVAQLLRSVQVSRRDYNLYAELGKRFEGLGDAAAAERARTSVLDLLPNDAEGHERLAVIREQQQRFVDAVVQWQHVSRLRPLDPAGLIGTTRNQVAAGDRNAARESLQLLKRTSWPPRFQQLPQQIAELEMKMGQ